MVARIDSIDKLNRGLGGKITVLVGGIRPVGGEQQLPIHPVDTPAIAVNAVANRLPVRDFRSNGGSVLYQGYPSVGDFHLSS